MKQTDITRRIDYLISKTHDALASPLGGDFGPYISDSIYSGFRSATLSFLANLLTTKHVYYTEFDKAVNNSYVSNITQGVKILESLKDEVEQGWFENFKGLVSAEIFSDFLEMGKYLLDEGYKDAAAVMIGSVLEEHLRQLCANNSIATSVPNAKGELIQLKADRINAELAKATVYGTLEQKSITAWLGLRNHAAHGEYDQYSKENVSLMHMGVLNFMTAYK